MKIYSLSIFLLIFMFFQESCDSAQRDDYENQQPSLREIINNQPPPNLNGYSFERDVVIKTYAARNSNITTYTYLVTEYGMIIKVCDSIGMPIPYSTQLTAPYIPVANGGTLPNPEPNSLYSPESAEGSIVNCVNDDGTFSPTYFEPRVISLPFEIKADKTFEKISDSSLKLNKKEN